MHTISGCCQDVFASASPVGHIASGPGCQLHDEEFGPIDIPVLAEQMIEQAVDWLGWVVETGAADYTKLAVPI